MIGRYCMKFLTFFPSFWMFLFSLYLGSFFSWRVRNLQLVSNILVMLPECVKKHKIHNRSSFLWGNIWIQMLNLFQCYRLLSKYFYRSTYPYMKIIGIIQWLIHEQINYWLKSENIFSLLTLLIIITKCTQTHTSKFSFFLKYLQFLWCSDWVIPQLLDWKMPLLDQQ